MIFVVTNQTKSLLTLMPTKLEEKSDKNKRCPVYKTYDQSQVVQLVVDINVLISSDHLVRIVDSAIENIEMQNLDVYYRGGGSSSYHPKMMLKLWIYSYCEGIYTSRRLSKALREQIPFIWLSGNQQPCFKTLSSFRSGNMEGLVDVAFKSILAMLVTSGHVDFKALYVDGSKWEANANRHQAVWDKNIMRYKQAVADRVEKFLAEIKFLQQNEDAAFGSKDLLEQGQGKELKVVMNSQTISEHVVSLKQLVFAQAEAQVNKSKKRTELEKLCKSLSEEQSKMEKYEAQEKIMGTRNSYNKTDVDSTMLRMKDERLLPGYNVQHTTTNQYVVNYTIAQNASDSPTLIPHLNKMDERFEGLEIPKKIPMVTDAGYGSEENYAELEKRKIPAYVKYALWHQEITGELAKKMFKRENWKYDKTTNSYTCPDNRKLPFEHIEVNKSVNGYERQVSIYRSKSCENCPFITDCKTSGDQARTVKHSEEGERLKAQAKELLASEEGIRLRKQRSIEVEPVFGDIKSNKNHDRFKLRGINKVYIEYGLLAMAHNLRKVHCKESGIWEAYYAQRAAKKVEKNQKRA